MVAAKRRAVRALNIIFDRSAFHGPAFDQLAQSPLAQLTRAGKLLVHHTPVFLEETLAMYGKEKNRAVLQRQIQFILSVGNGDWFRSLRTSTGVNSSRDKAGRHFLSGARGARM